MSNLDWELLRQDQNSAPIRISVDSILGSAGDCDILIMHPSVSPQHARLEIKEHGLIIYDLKSKYGTFIDGDREDAVQLSAEEDGHYIVSFGKTEFIIRHVKQVQRPPLPGSEKPPAHIPIKVTPLTPADDTTSKKKNLFMKSKAKDPNCIWYFRHEGQDLGPMTASEIKQAKADGRLLRNDLIWKEGMDTPIPASNVKGLFAEEAHNDEVPPMPEPMKQSFSSAVPEYQISPGLADAGHGSAVCPCCWYKFEPDEAWYISMHPDLIGDPVLGSDEPLRFLPDRFTPDGLALDAKGMRCTDMACPRCHMRIPSQVLHSNPFFLSIVGAPGSGKSHVLAASIWRLRDVMSSELDFSFNDVDAVTNHWLNEYEEKLFFDQNHERLNVILKTEQTAAHVFKRVTIEGIEVFLPMPCMFTFSPMNQSGPPKDCMVLYDNAGENFQVGNDTIHQPGTQHLVRSKGILFLYDPEADPRMVKHLKSERGEGYKSKQAVQRQDVLLVEMMSRIRRHAGLTEGDQYDNTLILALSKADLFGDYFDLETSVLKTDPNSGEKVLDMEAVAEMSYRTRRLLKRFAPEVVHNVESFARKVLFLPVSALGHNPDDQGILTEAFKPGWVEVPFLYFLANSGLMPSFRPHSDQEDTDFTRKGHILRFQAPETGRMHEVPWHFSGYELTCEETEKRFKVPYLAEAPQL